MTITSLADEVTTIYRDDDAPGVAHKPDKPEIRTWARSQSQDVSLFRFITSQALSEALTNQAVDHTDAGMLAELTSNVQTALDEGPKGGTLRLPPGDIPVGDTLVAHVQMDIVGQNGTRLIGWMGGVAKDLLQIRFQEAASGNGDARKTLIEGFTAYFGSGGLSVIDVENDPDLASNLHMTFRRLGLGGLDDGNGAALHIKGVVTQVHIIEKCGIDNQVWLDGCADSCVTRDCLMGGIKVANKWDLAEGAFRTLADHNTIVTRDGAFLILNAAEFDILRNQMEQSGANASTHSATITMLSAAGYGIKGGRIAGNNFGGGGNVQRSIWMDATGGAFCDDTHIDADNTFNTCASGVDIVLNSAAVRWTRINPSQRLRGNRNGVVITGSSASANSVDAEVAVTDSGLGTMGIWQPASTLSLGNGWSGSTDFAYMKDADGMVRFRGHLNSGTVAGGTLIGVMPAGFRPGSPIYNVCAASSTSTACVYFNSNGNITALGTPGSAGEVYPTPYKVARHTKYDPGV